MSAKKKAVKRKPRVWTRWAVVQDYTGYSRAFLCVGHSTVSKQTMQHIVGTGQQLVRVRITEVVK